MQGLRRRERTSCPPQEGPHRRRSRSRGSRWRRCRSAGRPVRPPWSLGRGRSPARAAAREEEKAASTHRGRQRPRRQRLRIRRRGRLGLVRRRPNKGSRLSCQTRADQQKPSLRQKARLRRRPPLLPASRSRSRRSDRLSRRRRRRPRSRCRRSWRRATGSTAQQAQAAVTTTPCSRPQDASRPLRHRQRLKATSGGLPRPPLSRRRPACQAATRSSCWEELPS
mmetsp:Transcript_95011/g.238284  ORF Transcript_95011/g.238284 Transcript_95011/m.238284 type:complete len:224 (-) Transcript_95011:26-697(-)